MQEKLAVRWYKIFKLFQILVESINLKKNEIDNLIEGIKKEKTNEELVHEIISNISNENKLIIIIDELDRCKPDFALKILEEIKHFFDIKNVIFLIVINPNEIANVIKKNYGANINSDLYLDKIIDNRLILPNINKDEYIENILFDCNCQSQLIKIMIQDISKYYNFELRQINHFILLVKNIFPNFKLQISMFDELDNILSIAKFFALNGVVIILIGTYLHDYNLYKKMINNKAKNEFKDIVIYSNDILNYFKLRKNLLNDDIEKNFLPIKNIEYLYDCFFNDSVDYLNSDEKKYQIREFGKKALLKCNVLTSLYSFNKNN